jgi:hypothetical protein
VVEIFSALPTKDNNFLNDANCVFPLSINLTEADTLVFGHGLTYTCFKWSEQYKDDKVDYQWRYNIN